MQILLLASQRVLSLADTMPSYIMRVFKVVKQKKTKNKTKQKTNQRKNKTKQNQKPSTPLKFHLCKYSQSISTFTFRILKLKYHDRMCILALML